MECANKYAREPSCAIRVSVKIPISPQEGNKQLNIVKSIIQGKMLGTMGKSSIRNVNVYVVCETR